MAPQIELKTLVAAGLNVEVYSDVADVSPDVVVLFLLHGRTQSSKDYSSMAQSLLEQTADKKLKHSQATPGLLVVLIVSRPVQ